MKKQTGKLRWIDDLLIPLGLALALFAFAYYIIL